MSVRVVRETLGNRSKGDAMQFVHEVQVEGRNDSYVFADFGDAQDFVAAVKSAGGAASDPTEHAVLSGETARDVIDGEASDD